MPGVGNAAQYTVRGVSILEPGIHAGQNRFTDVLTSILENALTDLDR